MSVLMTMSFRPLNEGETQPPAADRASNGNRNVQGEADAQAREATNVWRDASFAQAMRASRSSMEPGTAQAQTAGSPAAPAAGPLVGNGGTTAGGLVATLTNDLARTFAEAPAPDGPRQMAMLHSLSRHIAEEEAGIYTPAPARSDYVLDRESARSDDSAAQSASDTDAPPAQPDDMAQPAHISTRASTYEPIPHLVPANRAILAADGHLTPHANPDMIDVFKKSVENNNDWSRIRMSEPPDQAAFRSFAEPGANDRGPVTPGTERVARDHLQQEHDVDLQALPVRQMMIDDLFQTKDELVLMNDILEKIVEEVSSRSDLPPSDVDRLRFVKESEVLARGFMNDIIQHFMNSPRKD